MPDGAGWGAASHRFPGALCSVTVVTIGMNYRVFEGKEEIFEGYREG